MVIDGQVPGWHAILSLCLCSPWERRVGIRRENSLALYRLLVRGPICFPSSLIFIFGSNAGLPTEPGLSSPAGPPHLKHPAYLFLTLSPWPQPTLGQGPALTYSGAGTDPPNKDLFIQLVESGHGGTGNNWNII